MSPSPSKPNEHDDSVRRACAAAGWCSTAAFEEAEALRVQLSARGEEMSLLEALVTIGALDPNRAKMLRSGALPEPASPGAFVNDGQQATMTFARADRTAAGVPPQRDQTKAEATLDFDADDLRSAMEKRRAERSGEPRSGAVISDPPEPRSAASENSSAPREPDDRPFGADLPGRVLGGCRLERELGRGAMGVVFDALHMSLQRRVAVKVLMPSARRSSKDVEQFFQEARALARIEHQNIVQVHDVGEQDGLHYIVMQLLEGETVADRLDRQRYLTWEECCKLARDAAKGLAVAHEKQIVHRDIKPENLFVTNESVVKIADFGLAAQASSGEDGARTEVMGTPAYMSPEQIDGCNVDGRSDLYSLGCTMYVMLTGRKPFEGDTAIEVLLKQTKEIATPVAKLIPSVPLSVSQVVEKLMAKVPSARYQKAADLAGDLEKILGGGKPKVVIEIEDVMGRMNELAREVSQPRATLITKPAFVVAGAAILVAAASVVLAVALPAVDAASVAAGTGLPTNEEDAAQERRAREALAQVEAYAKQFETRPDLVAKQFEDLSRRWGEWIHGDLAASRELALQRSEAKRDQLVLDVRAEASPLIGSDPVSAVRKLFSLPEEARKGPKVDDWAQDVERALAAVRSRFGMAYVPGGRAKLGPDRREKETKSLLVDVFEVSNSEYAKFVRETGVRAPKQWGADEPPTSMRELPVVGVSATEADEYARWAGKRIPTADEWERAARGDGGFTYPWGADFDASRAVTRGMPGRTLAGVSTFPGGRSPNGMYHMAGNAYEWTSETSNDPLRGIGREVRGGSARSHPSQCVAFARYWMPADTDDPELLIGFRCVRDVK